DTFSRIRADAVSTPQTQFDFSSIADGPPPSAAPRAPRRRDTSAPYDFSSVAEAAPSRARSSPAPAPSSPAPSSPPWSLATGAPKVKDWYKQTFGSDLPVSSFGQDDYHNSLGLDHRNAFDVPLSPSSKEGQALVSYLRESG